MKTLDDLLAIAEAALQGSWLSPAVTEFKSTFNPFVVKALVEVAKAARAVLEDKHNTHAGSGDILVDPQTVYDIEQTLAVLDEVLR